MNIGIIGYGNVGKHLTKAIAETQDHVVTVFNRSPIKAEDRLENIHYAKDLSELGDSDLAILSIKDDAIIEILERTENLFSPQAIICHCSGSISSEVMAPYFQRYAVLYPLQTFSKNKEINYHSIPFFVTSADGETEELLTQLASSISSKVSSISDEQRMSMHIAAVFACNYVNAIYAISHKLCKDFDIPFDHLIPLIRETAHKVETLPPSEAQTGPAIRRDWDIVYKHEDFLNEYNIPIAKVYREMADYITKHMKG
ncbi:Rossmann-like and DUF2520 domain-containing protein [Membranihabitans marinus]|uniref:Rossmann-like and DUF2520 domain-containing protein n=1 Tax=Membranihabitans marinus TaxID=1227546 RepID=UPI001F401CA6|nr:Rossmann-like and DUF2520 domain-containing protein [Membranihabitans marinus]